MTAEHPHGIGVFDSGIGGLTVFKALRDVLPPAENLLYLGDTARVPYGTKSAATIRRYALEGARFLVARGIKALVIACNTMSALAIEELKKRMRIPIVGVIEPGAAAASRASRSGRIGVIGTAATIGSGAYTEAIRRHRADARVTGRACPLFVPLAEEGWVDNEVARSTARAYLGSLNGIDALVLGCTHYPLLERVIGEEIGPGVTLVDSAKATAAAVRECLESNGLLAGTGGDPGEDHFFVTDSSERFHEVGSRFLGRTLARLELVSLEFRDGRLGEG